MNDAKGIPSTGGAAAPGPAMPHAQDLLLTIQSRGGGSSDKGSCVTNDVNGLHVGRSLVPRRWVIALVCLAGAGACTTTDVPGTAPSGVDGGQGAVDAYAGDGADPSCQTINDGLWFRDTVPEGGCVTGASCTFNTPPGPCGAGPSEQLYECKCPKGVWTCDSFLEDSMLPPNQCDSGVAADSSSGLDASSSSDASASDGGTDGG
jgi:hypothetical protein